jgi:hypothetical protein
MPTTSERRAISRLTRSSGFVLLILGQCSRGPVSIWHGDGDLMVPLSDSRVYDELIPQADLTVVPGWGHPSLIFRQTEPLFNWLAMAAV